MPPMAPASWTDVDRLGLGVLALLTLLSVLAWAWTLKARCLTVAALRDEVARLLKPRG
jgi:hypothetical protein